MPRVTVITPFHNTAEYLGECIESILNQTFGDFSYLLVDNASTDDSYAIAQSYAARDDRIQLLHYDELIPQIPNYNRALRLVEPTSDYCKIAQADDTLMPRCLEEMLACADSDANIRLITAYTLLQNRVFLDGLDYYETVLDGNEVIRRYLIDGPYILGNPTTHMYRTRDVLKQDPFYSETNRYFADTEAALQLIVGHKMGFVHQVLSFSRRSNDSISRSTESFNINVLTRRVLLEKFGHDVFSSRELESRRLTIKRRHYQVLGEAVVLRKSEEFWRFHRDGLDLADQSISMPLTWLSAGFYLLRCLANAETTIRRIVNHLRTRAH